MGEEPKKALDLDNSDPLRKSTMSSVRRRRGARKRRARNDSNGSLTTLTRRSTKSTRKQSQTSPARRFLSGLERKGGKSYTSAKSKLAWTKLKQREAPRSRTKDKSSISLNKLWQIIATIKRHMPKLGEPLLLAHVMTTEDLCQLLEKTQDLSAKIDQAPGGNGWTLSVSSRCPTCGEWMCFSHRFSGVCPPSKSERDDAARMIFNQLVDDLLVYQGSCRVLEGGRTH